MLFERLLVHDDGALEGAALNMAIDETLFEHATIPVLRFYGWRRPALSFGYFGKFADVALEMERQDVVRRWTGGGIVPHGQDLTYSLVTPSIDPASSLGPTAVYTALHRAIRDALRDEAIEAELAVRPSAKISDACFANPVRDDVMLLGRKIAGAAQRRTRRGFLHQGSIQIPNLPESFRAGFASRLGAQIEWVKVPPTINERATQLVREKYGTDEWLRRW
jgi:lipoate-protein ligase A